jgi:DNA modification methylase
MGPFKGDFAF